MSSVSASEESFGEHYEEREQIGKGAFSVVARIVHRQSGAEFAAKSIDLRPLRLRESFSPTRLRREVEIMRRLSHPNIVKLHEVYEGPDMLRLVMELVKGTELLDLILSRSSFSEPEAKPIVAQVASAIAYLHEKSIVHRDIKPENVLILTETANTVRLLDFGLSKMIGADMGSVAKTFVGTPCYLAPEVEMLSSRQGTYGHEVDCWSLGAVVYVMLVARFPEFDRSNGRQDVRLEGDLWEVASPQAKDLIRRLMAFEPEKRLSVAEVLHHPWLQTDPVVAASLAIGPPLPAVPPAAPRVPCIESSADRTTMRLCTDLSARLLVSPSGTPVVPDLLRGPAMPTRPPMPPDGDDGSVFTPGEALIVVPQFEVDALQKLQRSIASCLHSALCACAHEPAISSNIRKSAVLCREQLLQSTKLLRKIEQTATSVLDMYKDLELAVAEGMPALAHDLFSTVKKWVGDLRAAVVEVQTANQARILQVHETISEVHACTARNQKVSAVWEDATSSSGASSRRHIPVRTPATTRAIAELLAQVKEVGVDGLSEEALMSLLLPFGNSDGAPLADSSRNSSIDIDDVCEPMRTNSQESETARAEVSATDAPPVSSETRQTKHADDSTHGSAFGAAAPAAPSTAREQIGLSTSFHPALIQALSQLEQVDKVLESLGILWANTEVIFEVLLQKSDHVEVRARRPAFCPRSSPARNSLSVPRLLLRNSALWTTRASRAPSPASTSACPSTSSFGVRSRARAAQAHRQP